MDELVRERLALAAQHGMNLQTDLSSPLREVRCIARGTGTAVDPPRHVVLGRNGGFDDAPMSGHCLLHPQEARRALDGNAVRIGKRHLTGARIRNRRLPRMALADRLAF
ncbi:hypothetical protein LAZ40_14685 [Cereibacter sphaeroides]|uniref:hypothetical protein n=1 Tax=Cereibacter sphaeroides TaxID=1063 RepID=UPI001F2DE612|nr:hypothetical protein [Cereibacter sphaeroides]MCE6951668.1 hypothetical protein [Cereibacter sphaeroides]MCE6960268.1 hypothetical protein [Cereibacter sphaeroides]MCE6969181.1 hypothetical protein [Cereibacter sphaeroides]MCE6974879.1 hypothetical protein [Cereibacter sphaeroides]